MSRWPWARCVELVITTSAHDEQGDWAPVRIVMSALAICDSDEQADAALALFERCPVAHLAKRRKLAQPATLDERYASGLAADPPGYRYACDNLYTNAPAHELVPHLRELFTAGAKAQSRSRSRAVADTVVQARAR